MIQNIIFTRKTPCFWYNFLYLFKWVWILHHLDTMLQLIHCNTCWYIATLLAACNVQWYKTSFLPVKHHVFDTISCIFSSECGAYIILIQFYSLIQCNTCRYNASFSYTLYRSLNQIIFLPAKQRVFDTISCRFSTEWQRYMK